MDLADSKKWQFAGRLEGQGVRHLALGERDLLVVQFRDEVLVINAGCIHCGEPLGTKISESTDLVCSHCGVSQALSNPSQRQCYPVMVVDGEIYVLLVAGNDESAG